MNGSTKPRRWLAHVLDGLIAAGAVGYISYLIALTIASRVMS